MAETYTKKNGRLVNSRGEWVWNGESYEYVISHSDWLPLVFKSKTDSDAFELLEKIWKAEQIVKNSHNQQEVTLAKEWLRKHSARHSDMRNVVYYVNDDVLQHWEKGKEAEDHKYKAREWVKGKWQYIYDTAKDTSKKVKDTANQASKTAKAYVNNAYNTGRSAVTTAVDKVKEQANAGIDKTKDKINSEIEAIKQAKEEARKSIEENNIQALPAAAVIGLSLLGLVAARLIVTAAALAYASNEAAKEAKKLNDNNISQREKAKDDNRRTKAKKMTEDQKREIMDKINPNYDPHSNDGWANNCYSCTLAYDMSRRGIDAKAIYDSNGESLEAIESCYEDAKLVDIAPSNPQKGFTKEEQREFINNIKNDYPDGAYGNMCVTWTPPYGLVGGHSIVWEKVDGEIIFRDCQTNTVYETEEDINKIFKKVGTAYYFRSDNLKPTTKIANYIDQTE